jgi:hypothetical protein
MDHALRQRGQNPDFEAALQARRQG